MATAQSVEKSPNAKQEYALQLVKNGVDSQVANDLAGRITRNVSPSNHYSQASSEAFLKSILALSRSGALVALR